MNDNTPDWVKQVQARGLGDALRLVLDALEPIGPLGAQVLWVAQPLAGVFGWRDVVGNLAETLEDPQQLAAVRHLLDDEATLENTAEIVEEDSQAV